jgi:ATP-dependent Lhr-like helicase
VAAFLASHGASFFDEMVQGTHLLGTELEDALSELVMRGRVHCDSYAGLRALLIPPSKRSSTHGRRQRRTALFGIEDAGRWSLVRAPAAADPPARVGSEAVEQVARILLRRYGVVCWRLLEREAAWLPPWRDLVRAYRRLEARGEIRGGRFIAGVAGEQFALPEAIGLLRELRRRPLDGALVCLAAADPANLLGTVMPGPKAARVAGSRVLYRDGVPIASLVAGQVELLQELTPSLAQAAQRALMSEAPSRVAELVSQQASG